MSATAIEAVERKILGSAGGGDGARETAPWLHVVSHLDPRFGGLSAVVPELARAVAGEGGRRSPVAAFLASDERSVIDGLDVTAWPTSRLAWMRNSALRGSFDALMRRSAGVHIHGLWEGSTAAAVGAARRVGRPYVISAHGMLEPWALRNKGWKKQVYAALTERANVAGASCLHALTEAEVEDYRRFGARQPIAVIPNGVAVPEKTRPELFLAAHPSLRGKRIVLFLGRIHFKKGLDLLVEAWSRVAEEHPEARLVLAGPDFENTRAAVERQVAERGVGGSVCFTGMLGGDAKWSAMAAAEAFVLPSYSEGLSVSALEAMGMGLPVILTTHCHLPEAARAGAGWEIPSEVGALTSVLQQLLGQGIAASREMGAKGQELVRDRFSWDVVAAQMRALYAWIAGGPEPVGVRLHRIDRAGPDQARSNQVEADHVGAEHVVNVDRGGTR